MRNNHNISSNNFGIRPHYGWWVCQVLAIEIHSDIHPYIYGNISECRI